MCANCMLWSSMDISYHQRTEATATHLKHSLRHLVGGLAEGHLAHQLAVRPPVILPRVAVELHALHEAALHHACSHMGTLLSSTAVLIMLACTLHCHKHVIKI
jgi:hypothetical protein